ncbi:cytosolic Fe-S cluster assembly factor NUBP2 isoform 1-T1 [Trichechus inunguis]
MEAVEEPGNLSGVRHIILVLSGKGGVGKSTISTELALALRHAGKKVGILDVDLCGPSVPRMLQAQGCAVHQCDSGWVPVFVDQEQSVALMSVGFLLETPDEAVVWRGPKKNGNKTQVLSGPMRAVTRSWHHPGSTGRACEKLRDEAGSTVLGLEGHCSRVTGLQGWGPHWGFCWTIRPRAPAGVRSQPRASEPSRSPRGLLPGLGCSGLSLVWYRHQLMAPGWGGGRNSVLGHCACVCPPGSGLALWGPGQAGALSALEAAGGGGFSGLPHQPPGFWAVSAALIKQFVSDVAWGELDFLVVDTPPGTSDEHLSAVEALRPYRPLGTVLVTTPQAVSVGDVRRELTFCRKMGLRVIGIVENMSGFVCPHCAECTNLFSTGGGEELARHAGVPFLGSVPLDPQLARSLEEGRDFIQEFPKSPAFPALASIARKILDRAQARGPD